jgi:hypothetical protein
MAAKKYAKYFIEYDPKWFPKEHRPVMARMGQYREREPLLPDTLMLTGLGHYRT